MARRAYGSRNRQRGREMETEVEEVAAVKVAVKVELDIALCMDPQVRERGRERVQSAGRRRDAFHLGVQERTARWWLNRRHVTPLAKGVSMESLRTLPRHFTH